VVKNAATFHVRKEIYRTQNVGNWPVKSEAQEEVGYGTKKT